MATPTRHAAGQLWRLLVASGLSNVADGVLKTAIPLVGLAFTRSPGLIAGLTVAVTLPWLLCALPFGALADRLDRRRAMIAANLVRGVLLGAMAIALALDGGSIAALYVVAFAVGATETLYDTSAQAFLPQLVGRDRLTHANARLFAVELTANQFVGPPVAGALLLAGSALTFATSSAAWLAAVVALMLIRGRFRPRRTGPSTLRADVAEGLRFLWRHVVLRRLALLVGSFNLCTSAAAAVLPLYLVGPGSEVGLTTRDYGILLTTQAIGSLAGSMVAERVEARLGRVRTLVLAFPLAATLVLVPAITGNAWVIGGVYVVACAALMVANVVQVSLRQRATPDRLVGRVTSAFRLTAWGTMPLGAALGGAIASVWGVRAVFLALGIVAMLTVCGLAGLTEGQLAAAERDAERDEAT